MKEKTVIINKIIENLPQTKEIMLSAIKLVNQQFEANYTALILKQKLHHHLADTQPFVQALLNSPQLTAEQKQIINQFNQLNLYFFAKRLTTSFVKKQLHFRYN